jgi:hypothetical protein|tara:strand:+ start:952 stop:1098 length:147 start_codon:yes stop_codon:yes gene_type:complete
MGNDKDSGCDVEGGNPGLVPSNRRATCANLDAVWWESDIPLSSETNRA